MIIMPLLAFALIAWLIYRGQSANSLPGSLVKSQIICFGFIAVSSEILSLFKAISVQTLAAAWLLLLLGCLAAMFASLRKKPAKFEVDILRYMAGYKFVLAVAGLILTASLLAALLYPPNNWDSMTYHLPRVQHWLSNQSLDFYPTHTSRQNYSMPMAELAVMHVQVLSGSDRYVNLVQWSCFLGLLFLVYLIADELRLGKGKRILAVLFMATLPMAILQASSTQNDLVVSFFILAFCLFMLRLLQKPVLENYLFASLSLGLALLSKGNAYLICAAIGGGFSMVLLYKKRDSWPKFAKTFCILALVLCGAMALNAGHLLRNYQHYQDPVSTGKESMVDNNPRIYSFVNRLLCNVAVHFGVPSQGVNLATKRFFDGLMFQDVGDRYVPYYNSVFEVQYRQQEDYAGNLIHMLVALLACLVLPFLWIKCRYKNVIFYAIVVGLCALLHCLILTWNPWISRIQTPIFALACPLLAIAIWPSDKKIWAWLARLFVALLLANASMAAVANTSRPLYPFWWLEKSRNELYFQTNSNAYRAFTEAAKVINAASDTEAGLFLASIDEWEYPFWVMADNSITNGGKLVFRHLLAESIAPKPDQAKPLPEYIFATQKLAGWEHAAEYEMVSHTGDIMIYKINDLKK